MGDKSKERDRVSRERNHREREPSERSYSMDSRLKFRFEFLQGQIDSIQQGFANLQNVITDTINKQIEKAISPLISKKVQLPGPVGTTNSSAAPSLPSGSNAKAGKFTHVSKKNECNTDVNALDTITDIENNRFASLMEEDTNVSSQDFPALNDLKKPKTNKSSYSANKNADKSNNKSKVPNPVPIIAYNLNHKTLVNNLVGQNRADFKITRGKNPDRHVILPSSKETREATLNILKEKSINFFTYAPREERNTTLVLKNVPKDYDLDDVKKEFAMRGLDDKIHKISVLNSPKLARFNFVLIQVHPGVSIDVFRNIKLMFHTGVIIEKFTNRDEPQCYRCQRPGHFSFKCQMPIRCVKCAESHLSKDCPIVDNTLKASLKCALCNEVGCHPASYRGCSKFKELVKAKKAKQANANGQSKKFTSEFVQKGLSFSSALKNRKTNNNSDIRHTQVSTLNGINEILNTACDELFGHDYKKIKNDFDNFWETYKSESSIEIKKRALLNFVMTTGYNG